MAKRFCHTGGAAATAKPGRVYRQIFDLDAAGRAL